VLPAVATRHLHWHDLHPADPPTATARAMFLWVGGRWSTMEAKARARPTHRVLT
jgi:hypothetical protein